MAYKYIFPRGWSTFNRKLLSEGPIVSSLSEAGDGSTHIDVDDSIDALQVWHRIQISTPQFGTLWWPPYTILSRARIGQNFGLAIREITCTCSGLDLPGGSASIKFVALTHTFDKATQLERPYGTVLPLASFSLAAGVGALGNASLGLNMDHTNIFPGPKANRTGSPTQDYDPVTGTYFEASLSGLLTSISLGWQYSGPVGSTLEGNVSISGVELFTVEATS